MEASLIGKALDFGSNDYGFESRASKINHKYWLSYVINHLNFGIARKNFRVSINYNKTTLALIKIFKHYGVVANYALKIEKKLTIIVHIYYYKNLSFIKNYKLLSSIGKSFFITKRMLALLDKKIGGSLLFLSCNAGLISHKIALKKSLGGKLVLLLL